MYIWYLLHIYCVQNIIVNNLNSDKTIIINFKFVLKLLLFLQLLLK